MFQKAMVADSRVWEAGARDGESIRASSGAISAKDVKGPVRWMILAGVTGGSGIMNPVLCYIL